MVRHVKRSTLRPRFHAPLLAKLSPFSKALLVAASVHCAFLAQLWLRRSQPRSMQPVSPHREFHVELEFGAAVANDTIRNATTASDVVAPSRHWHRLSQAAPTATAPVLRVPQGDASMRVDSSPPGEPNDSVATASELPSAPPSPTAERKINLGLNGEFLRMLDAQNASSPVDLPRKRTRKVDTGAELTRRFTAAILIDELRHGRARGNVLLGALDSAVRRVGPTRGQAIVRVTVNASGEVTGVELDRGADKDWFAVLRAFGQEARSRRVRVPDGAAGLKITFSISAKVQRPSGREVESTPVGVAGPSLAPNGLAMQGTFDLADLSNKSARMLAVRIINEEML
jgi:hypothetical protein